MSITLSVYEFFSYIIPGALYLYAFNEFLSALNLPKLDVSQLNTVEAFVLLGIAYIVGHIMNVISEFLWRRFGRKESRILNIPDQSLQRIKRKFSDLEFDFKRDEWDFLLNRLRQDEPELSAHLERFRALSLMLRNVAFSLYLLGFIYLGKFFITRDFLFIISVLGLFVSGWLASRRAKVFAMWFYNGVYSEGLRFGKNVQEVLLHNAQTRSQKSTTRRKTKA